MGVPCPQSPGASRRMHHECRATRGQGRGGAGRRRGSSAQDAPSRVSDRPLHCLFVTVCRCCLVCGRRGHFLFFKKNTTWALYGHTRSASTCVRVQRVVRRVRSAPPPDTRLVHDARRTPHGPHSTRPHASTPRRARYEPPDAPERVERVRAAAAAAASLDADAADWKL